MGEVQRPPRISNRVKSAAGALFVAALLCGSFWLLYREAREAGWEELRRGLLGTPLQSLAIAAFLIALNYILLMTYDLLALRYVNRNMQLRRVALVSFLGYSLGNNLGTLIAGAPIRLRIYSRFGLRPTEILAIMAFLGLTFWAGATLLSGVTLSFVRLPLPEQLELEVGSRTLGWMMIAIWCTYALTCVLWHRPLPIFGIRVAPPQPSLMLLQSSVAVLDLTISATALFLVLPSGAVVPFAAVLAAYLLGMIAGLATQVPGQLGVLEVVLLTLLKNSADTGAVLGSLLLFRGLYYVVPLVLGTITLVVYETTIAMGQGGRPK